jgi:hypothetical protein
VSRLALQGSRESLFCLSKPWRLLCLSESCRVICLSINVVYQYLLRLGIFYKAPCWCGRSSCEDVILTRMTHRIAMVHCEKLEEVRVAVSYPWLSVFSRPAVSQLLRSGRGRVAIEIRTSDEYTPPSFGQVRYNTVVLDPLGFSNVAHVIRQTELTLLGVPVNTRDQTPTRDHYIARKKGCSRRYKNRQDRPLGRNCW